MTTLSELELSGLMALEDFYTARRYIDPQRLADVIIAPDGEPYLFRWHVTERNMDANVYLHVQVADDPERPLHDHPWDNMSVILAGGYDELLVRKPPDGPPVKLRRQKGEVICRKAEEAHRLFLPAQVPYSMTLFTTGPHRRPWGFWCGDRSNEWVDAEDCIETLPDGRSVWLGRPTT